MENRRGKASGSDGSDGTESNTSVRDIMLRWLWRLVPGVRWIRGYRMAWLSSDVVAGITLAAVIVPIAMAYEQMSGPPAVVGIYASLLPLIAYALFGSSRLLILGPDTSTTALMIAVVAPLASGDIARYAALATALALIVGLLCLIGGVIRLGFVADFLSKPILVGYMNGLALTVIGSQLGKMTGIPIAAETFLGQIVEFAGKLGQMHWPTVAIGATTLAAILLLRRVAPRLPGALIAVVVITLLVRVLDLGRFGMATVGAIPHGLPTPRVPTISASDLGPLFIEALGIVLLTFSDTILNARTFAAHNHYPIDANQELIGLGVANLAAGIVQGYPVSASGTRTAVNEASGGKTQLAGVIAAVMLGGILLFLTDILSTFPTAALGAVLIAAVLVLIDVRTLRSLFQFRRREFLIALVALVGVLAIGLLEGILVAVGLSLLLLLARAVRPHDAVLGSVKGLGGFHDISDFTEAETIPGLIVYRFDGALFFANATYFRARVQELIAQADTPVVWFLLDAEAMTDVDATAAEILDGLRSELLDQGIVLAIARAKSPLRETLARAGLIQAIGGEHLFPSVRAGVAAFRQRKSPSHGPFTRWPRPGSSASAGRHRS